MKRTTLQTLALFCLVVLPGLTACQRPLYNPQRATRAYPRSLHTTETLDIQVFRDGPDLLIVNSTAHSYSAIDVWINQRYVLHLDALPAGENVHLSLWDFYDEFGEGMNAGGIWRTEEPTPVRMVEIQSAPDANLTGLITLRPEQAERRQTQ